MRDERRPARNAAAHEPLEPKVPPSSARVGRGTQRRFIRRLQAGLPPAAAAAELGVDVAQLREQRDQDPGFALELLAAATRAGGYGNGDRRADLLADVACALGLTRVARTIAAGNHDAIGEAA